MKWITREKIKVDRVACPWLIRQFIDPQAEFLFLPHDTDWSKIDSGTVFDVPNCELGHNGQDVSFNSILKKYGLSDHKILEREFVVYDALYGECKRKLEKTFPRAKQISMFEIASTVH